MSITASGPVTITANGQTVNKLFITSTTAEGVFCNGFSGVTINECEIHHTNFAGVKFVNSPNMTIEDCIIVHDGAPSGQNPNSSSLLNNIIGELSASPTINRVRLTGGSAGVYLLQCDNAVLSFLEGYNMRGPLARGQLMQANNSQTGSLLDFSCINDPNDSWPEDNINLFNSSGWVVRRGLLDGNNSRRGVAVMSETENGSNADNTFSDIDAINQSNGCFSVVPGRFVTYTNCRCQDTICTDQGRGLPTSGSLLYTVFDDESGPDPAPGRPLGDVDFINCSHFNHCNPPNIFWNTDFMTTTDDTTLGSAFTPRAAIRNVFFWESPPKRRSKQKKALLRSRLVR